MMKSLGNNLTKKDDCDIFGENVACQLRQLKDVRSRMIAKHRINEILFEMCMAQFGEGAPTVPGPSSGSSVSSGTHFSHGVHYDSTSNYSYPPSSCSSPKRPSRPSSAKGLELSIPIVNTMNILEDVLQIGDRGDNQNSTFIYVD